MAISFALVDACAMAQTSCQNLSASMARADRLLRLLSTLRSLPAQVTAARLAEETGVSPRQHYRGVKALRGGGA